MERDDECRTSPVSEEVAELKRRLQKAYEELDLRNRELTEARRQLAEAPPCTQASPLTRLVGADIPLDHESPTMVVTVDPDGRIMTINSACAGHLGYTVEELTGQPVQGIYHEEERRACTDQLRQCLQNPQQVLRRQFRKLRKDGITVWVDEVAQAIRDLNGGERVQVVCQDVTQQRLAAEERERLLVQLHAVLDSITEGVVISDLRGHILSMNAAALAMHQFASEEEIRRHLSHFETIFELTDLDRRPIPVSEWPLSRAMRGERFTDLEVHLHRRDTGLRLIASYSGTPVRTRAGMPILSVVTLRDVTDRKRAEEALRLSEQKFSKIFHAVPALLMISTYHDGRIIDVNSTLFLALGYERPEMVGRTVHEIGLWDQPDDRQQVLQQIEKHGFVKNHEVRFRRKGGDVITGLLSAETIELEGERCLVILVKDITDRKQIEEEVYRLNGVLEARAAELEATNQELEAFNYTVAHDLRRPLNIINGYCQFMQEACGINLDTTCQEYLDETYQATVRMNQLIGDLLNFARLSRAEPKREMLDLSAMANELAKELLRTVGERKVSFSIAEGLTAHADPALLRVVLENLIGNAWKFTGKKETGYIEVGGVERKGVRAYYVRDNGVGFSMADAEKIFLPFQRLATPDEFKGSGIGLATVERVIHRHGGEVWAEGKLGDGATFYFTLGE